MVTRAYRSNRQTSNRFKSTRKSSKHRSTGTVNQRYGSNHQRNPGDEDIDGWE